MLPIHPFQISYGPSDDRLHAFYIPALQASVRFDRTTGFFSSASLAIAASGVARLIGNGGKMRLLCGAQLSADDVSAIRSGSDLGSIVGEAMAGCLADPTDQSMKARLEALAWMVGVGTLEIRVVLPKGPDGLPRSAQEAREYYHPKEGLFVDADGSKLAFSGSSNDSADGWQWNYEVFQTFTSWERRIGADLVPHGRFYIIGIENRFERLWRGEEDDWIALDIPEAARQKLLKLRPAVEPTWDPLEKFGKKPEANEPKQPRPEVRGVSLAERVLFRFLREAPYMPNARQLGAVTCTVRPWPHQTRVVNDTVARFPESFLFCDEVGLGKTIETGLVLRQLLVSGRAKRVLLLVPKSVLKQWQEELYEKFALDVPRYDGGEVLDVFDRQIAVHGSNAWSAPILLASSQLAKRRERQEEVLSAAPWDLVIVDEAHHARRREFLNDTYRPNRLLELLAGTGERPGLRSRTKSIYLLTATPMQVHPVEVWDLLRVVGLGGRWGALQENFLEFFAELRKPFSERNWDFLLGMVGDFLDTGGHLDAGFCATAEKRIGFVDWEAIKGLPHARNRTSVVAQLDAQSKAVLEELVRRHTPLRRFMWRNTRTLLRRYKDSGLLKANVPERRPENVWIQLKPGVGNEEELYQRIDEYIGDFYQKYEAERKGLGFIMTVYRRRLTSSFFAIQRSLERRRDYLKGIRAGQSWLMDDDVEQDELDLDVSENSGADERARFLGELTYIDDFLASISRLGADSKLERLHDDLRATFTARDTVIIFTQYTDTMDYIRESLQQVYGAQVACYSGRGGERWDGAGWVPCGKERLKEEFRKGESIKILLCTESASEGLNLQTCGVLINYDMPWNPMRVEQRIGRIDRIEQKYLVVWVYNYFYEGTVEATIYQRLSDRIDWFETVVGELQPILHRLARAIQSVAMLRGQDRKRRLDEEVAALRHEIEEHNFQAIDLDAHVDDQVLTGSDEPVPVTLEALEQALVGSTSLGHRFRSHPDIAGAHLLQWGDVERCVTFNPEVFDRHPYTLELLTYGGSLLNELLRSVPDPPTPGGPSGIGLFTSSHGTPVSLFATPMGGEAQAVLDVAGILRLLTVEPAPWTESSERFGLDLYRAARQVVHAHLKKTWNARHSAERLALVEEARQLTIRAALLEVARSQQAELFDSEIPFGFGIDVVQGLKRHGAPFKSLLLIAKAPDLAAEATHPYWAAVQNDKRSALERRWAAVHRQAIELVQKYAMWGKAERPAEEDLNETPTQVWLPTSLDEARPPKAIPFRRVDHREARPYQNCIPLYGSLKAAAGALGDGQFVDGVPEFGHFAVEDYVWVLPAGSTRPNIGLFVAQVIGESMNRRIPNGAWCVWRLRPKGVQQGSVVLAEHLDINDVDGGGRFTVKRYYGEVQPQDENAWEHDNRIELRSDSTDPAFSTQVFEGSAAEELRIVAELVEVLVG
jgi:superfamily II DNA or RNA helicase